MVTKPCIKSGVSQFTIDQSNTVGQLAVEFSEGKRLAVVKMNDGAARIAGHGDEAVATENVRSSKSLTQ